MKKYEKPIFEMIELRIEERIAKDCPNRDALAQVDSAAPPGCLDKPS